MSDITVDGAILRHVAQRIRAAGRGLIHAGAPGQVADSATGPGLVRAELTRVDLEQVTRGDILGADLAATGTRPAQAADRFGALDKAML